LDQESMQIVCVREGEREVRQECDRGIQRGGEKRECILVSSSSGEKHPLQTERDIVKKGGNQEEEDGEGERPALTEKDERLSTLQEREKKEGGGKYLLALPDHLPRSVLFYPHSLSTLLEY
jgi:hypothetical protein